VQNLLYRLVFYVALTVSPIAFAAGKAKHVVVVVWDGMRPDFISQEHTPTLWQLARDGVMFENHHSVYCTATEVNGTAIATGCYPEHSGIIANRDYFPEFEPLKPMDTQTRDFVRKGDEVSGGNYLLRPTLAEILRDAGKNTVIAGSKEVALLHDRKERKKKSNSVTLFQGKSIPGSVNDEVKEALGAFPPDAGGARSLDPNEPRDQWTTRALLGQLWSKKVPAYSLLWLSEPDFSQHASGPGSPKALAALESSDRKLAAVLAELDKRGLRKITDIFVVSDHGFSTVEKSVEVSQIMRGAGFAAYREFREQPKKNDILVIGQGGSVLFYVIGHDSETIGKLVKFLQQQEFSGVVFTREKIPGTFTLDQAKIASPRAPDVVLSMRWSPDKSDRGVPGMQISNGSRERGAGNHASLSRFDVHNTLVGAGPDLKQNFSDTLPTANIDLAPTILWLLDVKPKIPMDGRVLSEALSVRAPDAGEVKTEKLEAEREIGDSIWRQYLQVSRIGETVYLDEGNGSFSPKN
jgi:arylsulfatase A-like enzyme